MDLRYNDGIRYEYGIFISRNKKDINGKFPSIDDYIKVNLTKNISIHSICSEFKISKNKLYEISHEWFKMPIGEYIQLARINEAKLLLSSTDIPIGQISVMVGINDYNYFSKFFRLRVGMSPLKYRKSSIFNLHTLYVHYL